MTIELIVTGFFWMAIWEKEYRDSPPGDYVNIAGLVIDHSVPITLLSIDYIFFSAIPIAKRHIFVVMTIALIYVTMNCIYSLNVEAIYGPINWRTPLGIITPIVLLVIGFLYSFFLEAVNRHKLRILGY